jgi:hypothetical protein
LQKDEREDRSGDGQKHERKKPDSIHGGKIKKKPCPINRAGLEAITNYFFALVFVLALAAAGFLATAPLAFLTTGMIDLLLIVYELHRAVPSSTI